MSDGTGRGPHTDEPKNNHVQFRASDSTIDLIDSLQERWGASSRSEVIRVMVHSHAGLMYGNFFALLDTDRLAEEWGGVGELLAAAIDSDRPLPSGVDRAQLRDVVVDVPLLLGAAHEEAGIGPGGESKDD